MLLILGKGSASIELPIQRSVLNSISPELAAGARRSMGGALHSPPISSVQLGEDSMEAWKILLHWKIESHLPPMSSDNKDEADALVTTLCRCWILGGKYDVRLFQDLIMLELLGVLHSNTPSLVVLKLVFGESKPNSKLCELMGEEIAYALRPEDDDGGEKCAWGLEDIEGIVELKDSMSVVLRGFCNLGDEGLRKRLKHRRIWRTYMVGEGPYWICGEDFDEEED